MVDVGHNLIRSPGLRPLFFMGLLIVCCHSLMSDVAFCGEPEASTVLKGEFSIGQSGRLILLPVQVDGESRSFLLDTGACRTGFDISLKHIFGEYAGKVTLQSSGGTKQAKTYGWPVASIRDQVLRSERSIAAVDFTELRQATNHDISGVLGMDVLGNNRFQIDFDRGVIRFFPALPEDRREFGDPVPIEIGENGAPFLRGQLDVDVDEAFLIDTGAHGNALRSALFDQMVRRQQLQIGTNSFISQTVTGQIQGQRGRLQSLSFGSISHQGLRFARVDISAVGLRFLSRYVVTFDFPGRMAYFKKGLYHDRPEPNATSGMTILWIDRHVIVTGTKENGPAKRAGIQTDDEIIQVNGTLVSDYDHHSLRQLLTSTGGRKVAFQTRRDGQLRNVELTLDEDQ